LKINENKCGNRWLPAGLRRTTQEPARALHEIDTRWFVPCSTMLYISLDFDRSPEHRRGPNLVARRPAPAGEVGEAQGGSNQD